MSSTPLSIAVHLGAHKTASTHLQRSLAAVDLPGVQVIGPPQLRGQGKTLPERFGFPLSGTKANAAPKDVGAVIQDLADGATRLVISDENFAGKLQTGWGRVPTPLYPTATKRLTSLAQRIQGAAGQPLDLFLAIRNPATYLTSVYSQVLHGGRMVWPAASMDKNDPAALDWADYAQGLRGVAGIRSLTVWRFEDYTTVFGQVTRAMTGVGGIAPLADRVQQGLSQAALEALMQAKAGGVGLTTAEAVKAYPISAENPGLTLYDDAVRGASDVAYARQWAALRKTPGITCITAE